MVIPQLRVLQQADIPTGWRLESNLFPVMLFPIRGRHHISLSDLWFESDTLIYLPLGFISLEEADSVILRHGLVSASVLSSFLIKCSSLVSSRRRPLPLTLDPKRGLERAAFYSHGFLRKKGSRCELTFEY